MSLRSLAWRLALWVLAGAALVFVASGYLLFHLVGKQLLQQAQRESAALASQGSSLVQLRLNDITNTTRVLAAVIEPRPRNAASLIHDALADNADLAGLAAAFVPGSTAAQEAGQSPFVDRQSDGTLAHRDLFKDPQPYWNATWFQQGLVCNQGCWHPVFWSQSRHRLLVSYSAPMQADDNTIGVVNADVTLDWLQGVLLSMHLPAGTHAFVMDQQGRYLANDAVEQVGKEAQTTLLSQLSAPSLPEYANAHRLNLQGERAWMYDQPIAGTQWKFAVVVPEELIYAQVRHAFMSVLVLGALTILLLGLIVMITIRRTLAPLGVLAERAELVARGALDFALPRVRRHDEVGRLTHAFDRMRLELAAHLEELTRVAQEQARLASELDIAQQIQTALLPGPHYLDARCQNFELFAVLKPARSVGGDLYSYFMLPNQRFCFMVGDVADKGIPAALFMARTITLAKAMASRAQSPQHLLQLINDELCRNNDSCMFVTLLCGFLDVATGYMTLASAGHDPPVLWGNQAPRWLPVTSGSALGLDEAASFPAIRVRLKPGDTLLMYTDGVTEAASKTLEQYGGERLLARLGQFHDATDGTGPRDPTKFLVEDIEAFSAGHGQSDDIALLALRWNHAGLDKGTLMLDLVFPATLEKVFDTLNLCAETLHEAGIRTDVRADVRLVLEELMVNMVHHGNLHGSERTIGLRMMIIDEAVLVELNHDGAPFDPLQFGSPTLTGDLADREDDGGLGIHLVRAMSSELNYTHDEDGNHLQLRFANPTEHGHGT
ncbi:SpoIIE family protein phosphatase [Dyella nitratireducens]|uniref:IcfG protein n=1 Tax=Dyella nitratireducens TaxID=1849580 RepID=A0ABQ1GXC6_9GAMM|nr:SpoIIE family protein phosphatase [Dyella nitratireducens]GGA52025.1 IcfG protein [Dyella nitratireducens]GLQ41626.1 IcfG protein [Dyella nitratireducens]